MTTLREAAQQALEALQNTSPLGFNMESDNKFFAAITALKAALAEPVQEPVAWMDIDSDGQRLTVRQWSDGNRDEVPLYTAPPQRKPLTDEEIDRVTIKCFGSNADLEFHRHHARAIERAHGITGPEDRSR